jgi:hypothetical protein
VVGYLKMNLKKSMKTHLAPLQLLYANRRHNAFYATFITNAR